MGHPKLSSVRSTRVWLKPPHPGAHSSWPKREGSRVAQGNLGSNNHRRIFGRNISCFVVCLCSIEASSSCHPSGLTPGRSEWLRRMTGRRSRTIPKVKSPSRGFVVPIPEGFHCFAWAVARARHAAYVFRSRNMCQMIVASFLITATRAMEAPRLRLMRLNHSRNCASIRNA